jgi:hypothetical protein
VQPGAHRDDRHEIAFGRDQQPLANTFKKEEDVLRIAEGLAKAGLST